MTLEIRNEDGFDSLCEYIKGIFKDKKYFIKCFKSLENKSLESLNKYLKNLPKGPNRKFLIIIEDHPQVELPISF